MALQNVQKLEQQEVHKKTWFNRFRGKAAATGAIVTGAVVASSNALAIKAADIATATSGSGAEETIDAGWLWVLGIAIVLYVGRKIVSMFGR
ncbi:hypothetical protein [Acinetobacter entericus]|uniref:Bacteriophage coat protein B n=1 Tax=Acinetobacter entericus TaxID=2989714 RepID=A0ABT3NQI8_9GAMM|nr:hypothetical protein [Acinetobacter entericus]MCW8041265.1 hypothetical protein [Acinetobacter entericus]